MPSASIDAQREYQRAWIANRRQRYMAGQVCVDCGSTENIEIDHVDPADKVSHRIWSWRHDRLMAELAKCVMRCSSCHSARHGAERRSHGPAAYNRGCRCDVCREAKRAKNARYRASVAA